MLDGELDKQATAGAAVRRRLAQALSVTLLGLLAVLLFLVFVEAWLGTVLGSSRIDASGHRVLEAATWPKALKSALYIGLFAVAVAKLTVDRRWAELRTKADMALVLLGLIMVVAGLVAGSSSSLIGEALFVYFRGVIVFYAWRALKPPWRHVRMFCWVFGGLIALYAAIAVFEMVVGYPAYPMLGWVDMTWARINRAHALLPHPNDLGHVTGLMLLGLLAWFVSSARVRLRWWLLFALIAAGLAATQSRESAIGVAVGIALIAVVRRAHARRIMIAAGLVLLTVALPLVLSPSNRAEWARRFGGVLNAVQVPSGAEGGVSTGEDVTCDSKSDDCQASAVPPREIRVLFMQQGLRLWLHRPLLGYGVGQFGGIVAYRDDPNWNTDPRFGPDGFDRHGFSSKTVDSFWLHLVVETGALGALAYLAWMFFLAQPLLREGRRLAVSRDEAIRPVVYWAPAALAFGALIAVFAPSLEDPLFPPLMFSVVGIAWAMLRGAGAESPVGGVRRHRSPSAVNTMRPA